MQQLTAGRFALVQSESDLVVLKLEYITEEYGDRFRRADTAEDLLYALLIHDISRPHSIKGVQLMVSGECNSR